MYPTVLIAKFLGILFIVFALTVFTRPAQFKIALKEVISNPAHFLLITFINLVGGTLLVLFHNDWEWSWALLVTLLCWILFIRAIGMMFFPEKISAALVKVLENPLHFRMVASIHLILGLFLIYIGFIW